MLTVLRPESAVTECPVTSVKEVYDRTYDCPETSAYPWCSTDTFDRLSHQLDELPLRLPLLPILMSTDGEPLPELAQPGGDPGLALRSIHAAITHRGIAVDYHDTLGGALGLSCGGAIRVVRGLAPASEFVVLAHEFAHELLHHGDGPRATRETRELEAEAVAFVVSTASGLETLAASVDYVHLYRGDRPALAASLDRIQRTAATILRAMDSD